MTDFYKNKKIKKGFTLIEALVAISILLIAIAGPMSIAQKGLAGAEISKDEATASFLAQDAIEGMKNIRDKTALDAETGNTIPSPTAWLSGLENCSCTGASCNSADPSIIPQTYCNIDTTTPTPIIIDNSLVTNKLNPMQIARKVGTGAFLGYNLVFNNTININESPSIFSRYINITQPFFSTNPNEAEVNVKVTWQSPSGPQSVSISDFIYNYSANL